MLSAKSLFWSKLTLFRLTLLLICSFVFAVSGCAYRKNVGLPNHDEFTQDQLVVRCDFKLPRRHRLLAELAGRRDDISQRLLLPTSDEPINVYIFENEPRFRKFMRKNHPQFPHRRAFFVKDDTNLNVYAYWGNQVAEDLRHEVTHSYLHAVVPCLPLWMDEGLAEFFEMPRGQDGFNRRHVYHLIDELKAERWTPNLERLERLNNPLEMTQLEYAESWLWIHFLLESSMDHASLLQNQLARLRMNGQAESLSTIINKKIPAANELLVAHLLELADQL